MWKTKSDAARRMIQAKFAQKRMARMKPVKTVQPAGGRTMPPASVLAKPQPAKLQLAKEAGPLAQDSPAAENCLAAKAGPAGWQEGRGLLNDGTQSAGRASLQAHVLACGNPLGLEAQLEGRLPATPGSPVPPDPLFLLGQAGQASDRVLADSMACGQNVAQDCVQACVKACTKDCFKAAGEANADAPAATALQAASAMSCALSSVRTTASASTRPRPRRRIKPRAEDGSLMALYREAAAEVLRMALAEDEASGSPSPTSQLGQPSQPDQHSRPLKPFQSGESFQASRTQHSPQALHARQAPQSPRASGRPQSVDAAGLKGKPAEEPGPGAGRLAGPDAGRLAGPYAGHRAGPDALKAGKGAAAPASAPVSGPVSAPISGPKTAQASAPNSGQASAAAGLALSARLSVHVEAAGLGQPSASNASFQASLHLASAGPEHGQAWRDALQALQTRYSLQVLKSLEDLGPALLVPKRVPKRAGKTLPAQGLTTAGRARSEASKPHTPRSDAPLSETTQSGSPGVKAQAQARVQAATRHAGQAYAGPAHAGQSPAARLPAGTRKAGQSRSSERIASQVPASGHRGCRHASHDKQPGNVKQAKQAKQPMHPSQIRQANQIRQPSPCPLPRQFPGLQGLAPLPQHGKPVQPGKPGKLSKPAKPVIPSSPAAPHQPAQENRSMQQRTQLSAFQPVDQATSQPSAVLPWDRDDEELSPPQAGAMPLVSGMPPVTGMSSGQAGGCPEHPGPAAPAQGAACPPGCYPGFEHRFTGSCAGMAPQAMAQASFASQRLFDEDGDELFGCVLFDSGRSFNGWAALEDGEALRLPPQGLAALPRQGHFFSNLSWEARSGVMGYETADRKYVSRYNLKLQLAAGASLTAWLEYDSAGTWQKAGEITTEGLRTVLLPVRPRRCDHLRLKLTGEGACKLLSVTRVLEVGSDE